MSIFDGVVAPELKVELDLTVPLGPKSNDSTDWTVVPLDLVRNISIRRGKSQENQVVQPGECTIVLDNRSGDFDPMNVDSPYWFTDLLGGMSYLSPRLGIRITAIWDETEYILYVGYLEQVSMDYGLNPTTTLTFVDLMGYLSQQQLVPVYLPVGNGDQVWFRCDRILDRMGAPLPSDLRGIDTSVDATMYGTKFEGDVLTLLQQAADCEPARLFVDSDGLLRVRPLDAGDGGSLTLTDDPTDVNSVGYDTIEVDPGTRYLVNWVTVNKIDGEGNPRGSVTRYDTDSIIRFGISQASYDLPVNTAAPVAQALAYQYSEPINRIKRISFSHVNLGVNFPLTLTNDIGDVLTVVRTTYDGRTMTFEVRTEGVEHEITPDSWRVAYICSTDSVTPEPGGDYWFAELGYKASVLSFSQGEVGVGDNLFGYYGSGGVHSIGVVSKSGVLQWQRSYDTGFGGFDGFSKFALLSDGGLVFTGSHATSPKCASVIATDADGIMQWATKVDATSGFFLTDSAVDSTGNVYLSATVAGNRATVVKLDNTGALVWHKHVDNTSVGKSVAVDTSGNVYLAGQANFGSGTVGMLAKFSSAGALTWALEAATGGATSSVVKIDNSGAIWWDTNGALLAKVSSSGTITWQINPGGATLRRFDSSNNAYFATGGNVIQANSSGTIQLVRTTTGNASLYDVATDSDGDFCLFGLGIAGTYYNGFLGRVPGDGTETGTYTITGLSNSTFTYTGGTHSFSSSSVTITTASASGANSTVSVSALTPTETSDLRALAVEYL